MDLFSTILIASSFGLAIMFGWVVRRVNTALILIQTNQFQRAIRLLKPITYILPTASYIHYYLGVAYAREQSFVKAEERFRFAIKCFPGYSAAYIELGKLLHIQGRIAEAEEAWKRII